MSEFGTFIIWLIVVAMLYEVGNRVLDHHYPEPEDLEECDQ